MSFKDCKSYKFGELYNVFSGLSKSRDQFGYGHPFVTFRDVFHNYFLPEILTSLANTNQKEIKSCSVKKGDIFLTRTSETQHELGQSSVALKDYPNATFNGFTKRLRLKENIDVEIDLHYLGYYCRSPFFRSQIVQFSSLTTRASLNTSNINSLELRLPKLEEQIIIGEVLKSLDDKIELNRQTNQTLEDIAEALFKEMCLPKGEDLPAGWRVGKLGDLLEIKYGKDHKHLEPGSIPVYGSGGIMRYANKALYEMESILIPRKGTLSNLFYVNKPFWSVDTMFYTKISNPIYTKFLFLILKSLNLAGMNVGSAVPSLTTEILNKIEINVPTAETLKHFNDLVNPVFKMLDANKEESQTLTQLRDSLLPKLIKGELLIN